MDENKLKKALEAAGYHLTAAELGIVAKAMDKTTEALEATKLRCGGCSTMEGHRPLTTGKSSGRYVGLYWCGGCGGLIGTTDLPTFNTIVKPTWYAGPDAAAETRYFDVDIEKGGETAYRTHGWYDTLSGHTTQTG